MIKKLYWIMFLFATAAVLLAVGIVVVAHNQDVAAGYIKYDWKNTDIKDIRTRVVQRHSSTVDTTIEFPVTSNEKVNKIISDTVNGYDSAAKRLEVGAKLVGGIVHQSTGYQLIRQKGNYLSISVSTLRDISGNGAQRQSDFWTFDLSTGKVVTLDDVFGDRAADGKARLFIFLKRAINKQLPAKLQGSRLANVDSAVSTNTISSFEVVDGSTMQFDLVIAGDAVTVKLPIDNLQLFLQTATARAIFTILPVGAAPEFEVPATAITSAATPAPDCLKQKCIALTFDDGPSSLTPRLLEILRSRKAHASFFVIGQNIGKYPDTVKREYSDGNTVGNHTWSHRSLPYLSASAIDSELMKTNQALQAVTGVKPTYMRPPNGSIGGALYSELAKLQLTGVLWSVDTRDWADQNSDIILNRVVSNARPGGVVILHDTHTSSIDAVPQILETLQKQGYVFVSIEQMFGPNAAPGKIISRAY